MFYKRTLFWALCRDSITSSPCFPEMSVARVNKITNEKVLAHRTELWECGARKVTPRTPRGTQTSIYFHWYFYSRDGLRPKGGSVRSIQGIFITKITVLYLSDLPRSVQKQSPWETNLSPMLSFYSTVEDRNLSEGDSSFLERCHQGHVSIMWRSDKSYLKPGSRTAGRITKSQGWEKLRSQGPLSVSFLVLSLPSSSHTLL